jgi:hypothetical protein
MTPNHHVRNEDDGDEREKIYEACEEWNGNEKRKTSEQVFAEQYRELMEKKSAWSFTPQAVSTYMAVFGLVIGAAWTFSDFRVTLNDLQTRTTNLSERMNMIDKRESDFDTKIDNRISAIDNNGTRQLVGTDAQLKAMKDQVDSLKDAIESVNGAIMQHNESIYDLYRKQNPGRPMPKHHEGTLPYLPQPKG